MRLGAGYRIRAKFTLTTAVKSVQGWLQFSGDNYLTNAAVFSAGITPTVSSAPPSADATFMFYNRSPAQASFEIEKSLSPGTYYLWLWATSDSLGCWAYGAYSNRFALSITGVQQTCTVTLPTGDGYIVSGVAGEVVAGSDYSFSVTTQLPYVAGPEFTVTANDVALTPGDAGEYAIKNISEDVIIRVDGVIIGGIVRIANGGGFDDYLVYIANGSAWEQYLPYVADGSSFNLHS